MNTAAVSSLSSNPRLPLARVLTLLLAGAFAALVMDLRVEHVAAVREHAIAWLPIAYAGVMALACVAAFVIWRPAIRRAMAVLFLLAFAIGGAGFYLHNDGHVKPVLTASLRAWTRPHMSHKDGPPQTAPLAFAGLGAIGVLASVKRFDR